MANGAAVPRVVGAGLATINRRKIQIFFQRFPGTSASSGIQGLDFTVTIDGGAPRTGRTPADGKIEIRLGAAETATLQILGSQYQVTLLSGGLHPVTELRGTQQRLNMLGYAAGALESGAPPVLAATSFNQNTSTEHAIIDFQSDNNPLFIDAIAGPQTVQRLRQVVQNAGGE